MRGRKRLQPGYHASRGWFYKPVQTVICKWDAILGREVTNATFHQVRRVMEAGEGNLVVYIQDARHRTFVSELMVALDQLHAQDNSHGWVVKMWSRWIDKPNKRLLLTYSEIREKIIEAGGPMFSEDALKQSAKRLRLIVSSQQKELDEQSAHHPNPARSAIRD